MERWRRKSKGKKRVNSDNGGREVEKDETKTKTKKTKNKKKKTTKNKKRKRVRQRKVGSQNSAPTLKLSLRLCQLNQIELTQWTKKKKKKLSLSKFSNIPNTKFSNSYSQCPNVEFNSSIFNKNSNFKFHDQDSEPWF